MKQDPNINLSAADQWEDVITRCLGWYTGVNAQARVFHCLEMVHPQAEGVQRVRCFPFSNHTFNERNVKDPVFFMPVEAQKDFSLPQDQEKLEYGRVHLFFSILLPGYLGRLEETDLALVQYLDHYKIKGKLPRN
jgi:hypothetical protein